MNFKADIQELHDELIRLRRDFHTHPELGLQEVRTSQIVEQYLKDLGLEVNRCTPTGIIGLLKGGRPGKTVMLRCDMDALPVTEETGLPFSSETPGVMHACGHDGHLAMLLITAKMLTKYRAEINGAIKFLFQPNEEDAGAELMIEQGALENPRPDAVCGLHLWSPIPTGQIGIVYGPIMASSYYFKLVIQGKGGHGGSPHTAINPIDTAAHVLEAIKTFQSLEMDALTPTVISVCKIHGGTKEIIVPDEVELEGSIRCLHDNDAAVRERLAELIEGICQAYRCTCQLEFKCGNTMLNNDSTMTDLAIGVAEETVGREQIVTQGVSVMLGDDFAEFSRRIPGVYFFVGTASEEKQTCFAHHHPKFNIDEDSLAIGVEMQARLALAFLNG